MLSTKYVKIWQLNKKLALKFLRLFEVEKPISKQVYELKLLATIGKLHPIFPISLLELYCLHVGKELRNPSPEQRTQV